ncbi:NAD(P)-dependent oxidoreductase [Paraburkholderia terricola]|uniref:3-hydroxyisobutyrate dehydrogenase n=1 Tax=Paraburkholderia terricola TaxID=169427 RepID=A0A1M6T501_9BURK|nr:MULTISPECIES: NAD(P)-dependent oxidoreductase [Paraburkholderia]SDO69986.1 3-hydroxyisobutyrate dehydrogenase [Paraburkholderia sediminicola]SHK52027.1 3-hydroxyisobutyrate dehydrogenase [Paraburkholderia terricola]
MRVGYIGLGAMGGALARHLIGKFPLSVFDLNKKAVDSFVELGAAAAATPAELARNSDLILLCLPRSSDVQAVLFGQDGVAQGVSAGKIVIDQTSGVPAETRAFARQLEETGVLLFDAPVSGAMATAIAGTISIIASGPRDAFERALPVLQSISPNVFHCGERVSNGQTMKTVNNMMNVSCRLATLEVVAMGKKLGLPLELMTQAINATTARNYTSQGMLPAIAEGRQSTRFWLALQVKDIHQAISLAAGQKVPMPIGGAARSLLQIGLNSLGKDAQLEQMIGVIESMADTRFVDTPTSSDRREAE